jgi:hypothetical protein
MKNKLKVEDQRLKTEGKVLGFFLQPSTFSLLPLTY